MIVVCKKFRQIGQSNGVFKINEHRKEMRSNVKIDELDVAKFNAVATGSGIYYEIDKESTKKRNELLNPKPKNNRAELKAKATDLGLEFADNIPTPKLIELIESIE